METKSKREKKLTRTDFSTLAHYMYNTTDKFKFDLQLNEIYFV